MSHPQNDTFLERLGQLIDEFIANGDWNQLDEVLRVAQTHGINTSNMTHLLTKRKNNVIRSTPKER